MISTIGEAHDLGWTLRVYCRWGKRDAMKSIRECTASVDVDLKTLSWTRGRDFPITRLDSRMKCMRCGSRRVMIAFSSPAEPATSSLRRKA
jgi:hypothetical protein